MATPKAIIIEKAQQFAVKGKIKEAIYEWQKLVAESPQDGSIHNTIADLYLRINEKESAIDSCLKAAAGYKDAGFDMKGIAVLKKVLKIDPNRVDIYERLADINMERGLAGSAIAGYQDAAKLYMKQSNFKAAVTVYQKLARQMPEDVEVHLAIARLYQKQERYKEAVVAYEQVEALYESKQMVSEARQIVEEIVKIDPNYLKHLVSKEAAMAALDNEGPKDLFTASSKPTEALLRGMSGLVEETNRPFQEPEIFREILPISSLETPPVVPLEPAPFAEVEGVVSSEPPMTTEAFLGDPEPVANTDSALYDAPHLFSQPVAPEPTPVPVFSSNVSSNLPVNRPVAEESGEPSVSEVILKAHLAEAQVYVRYGLYQNAIGKLLLATELSPLREEPYLQLKEIYLKQGQNQKATETCLTLIKLYDQKKAFDKKEALLGELQALNPQEYARNFGGVIQKPAPSPVAAENIDVPLWNPIVPEEVSYGVSAPENVPDEEAVAVGMGPSGASPSETKETQEVSSDPLPPPLDEADRSEPVVEPETPKEQEEYFDFASVMTEELGSLSEEVVAVAQKEKGTAFADPTVSADKREQYLETCYHLGIAHKEMGNFAKAIREFEQALSGEGGPRFQELLTLLASCYTEQGDLPRAIDVLQGGIDDPRCTGNTRLAIQYELASSYEQQGEREKSFLLYKEIYRVNPKFRDVSGKIKEIPYRKPSVESARPKEGASPVRPKRRVSYV